MKIRSDALDGYDFRFDGLGDWLLRCGTPLFLDAVGRSSVATELRALDEVTDTTLTTPGHFAGLSEYLKPVWEELRAEAEELDGTVGGTPPAYLGTLSALDFSKRAFPGVIEAGNAGRYAFQPSHVGRHSYGCLQRAASVALARSGGEVTAELSIAYDQAMDGLRRRGTLTTHEHD